MPNPKATQRKPAKVAVKKAATKASKPAIKTAAAKKRAPVTPVIEPGDQAGVDAYMRNLSHPLKNEAEALRRIILGADSRITESIKWNAPSFFFKEYFATLHLRQPGRIQVIFHLGAKAKDNTRKVTIDDPNGLLTWPANDRAVAKFDGMGEVSANRSALGAIVRQWMAQM